jgi:hypothetical protein
MSGILELIGVEAGDLSTGTGYSFQIGMHNTGDEPLVITAISSDNPNAAVGSGVPITVNPGDNDAYFFTLTPTAPGPALITFVHTGINSPISTGVAWTTAGPGTKQLTVNPSVKLFPNTKLGTNSAETLFTVSNSGTVDVTVSACTFATDFIAGPTANPAFPHVIHPGANYTFGIKFHPLSLGYLAENVAIVSDAVATPFNIACSGIAFAITPSFTIEGGRQSLLFALAYPVSDSIPLPQVQIPENPITWTPDAQPFIDNTFMLPFQTQQGPVPGFSYEKQIPRVLFHYEDYGIAVVTVQLTSERGQTVSQDVTIGTVGADQKTKLAFADVNITDEIHTLTFTPNGPFFLVDYVIKYVPKGEKKK